MDFLTLLLDFILHVDVHLVTFVATYGIWVYALLFLIIFVETGVVVMPFLPGDSLLFVVGALCGVGLMNLSAAIGPLIAAAILGNQSNYTIGRYFPVWCHGRVPAFIARTGAQPCRHVDALERIARPRQVTLKQRPAAHAGASCASSIKHSQSPAVERGLTREPIGQATR